MRNAVIELLAPADKDFADHRTLLQLSKDADGRPKLLTTNFDTLFERAAVAAGISDVPSHAAKAIPTAGLERDYGILHLHGRIKDATLLLDTTDLVLTSADFGDADRGTAGPHNILKIACDWER